ncbi:hypothetical protein L6232_26325, partial [Shewanella sp. C31]|nr:hypothetical protein [Shewanella electrica]
DITAVQVLSIHRSDRIFHGLLRGEGHKSKTPGSASLTIVDNLNIKHEKPSDLKQKQHENKKPEPNSNRSIFAFGERKKMN